MALPNGVELRYPTTNLPLVMALQRRFQAQLSDRGQQASTVAGMLHLGSRSNGAGVGPMGYRTIASRGQHAMVQQPILIA